MTSTQPDIFFLCCGPPKSGTTFLQRTIDLHPDISCPSEQSFPLIHSNLERFVSSYNDGLKLIDYRTGGQGARLLDDRGKHLLLRSHIRAISKALAGPAKIHGLNDNSVIDALPAYDGLLAPVRIIVIVRNPVDRATSLWRHNHRLARNEPKMADKHLQFLENPEKSLEGYARLVAAPFNRWAEALQTILSPRQNFLLIRYEDFVKQPSRHAREIFNHLGAPTDDQTLDGIMPNMSKEAMASNSSNPEFFGLDDQSELFRKMEPSVRHQLIEDCRFGLGTLGYHSDTIDQLRNEDS